VIRISAETTRGHLQLVLWVLVLGLVLVRPQ